MEAPQARWKALKMKATRVPGPPQDTYNTSLQIQEGEVPSSACRQLAFGESWGLGEECPQCHFRESRHQELRCSLTQSQISDVWKNEKSIHNQHFLEGAPPPVRQKHWL